MGALVIKNATLVLPDEIITGRTLLARDGVIVSTDHRDDVPIGAEVLDAEGGMLFSGFIDLHVHGGGGADFMDETPEAFEAAVRAHLEHGTTLLYPTAVAAKKEELITFLKTFRRFKEQSRYSKFTPGVHFEGPYFFGAGQLSRGAQRADTLRLPDLIEVEELLAVADGDIKRWDAAPELPGAYEFARYITERGVLCAVGHTDATAEETEGGYQNGFSHVTHFYNATSMHRKREQTVYAGVVEATYLNDGVTIELIGDGCHIPREDVLLGMKIKGREKISLVTDGTRFSGSSLLRGRLGNIDTGTEVIVEAGVAKLLDRSSFAGSTATMDRCLSVMCRDYGISPSDASVMLSLSPARCMGIDKDYGSIEVGKAADLVLTDNEFNIKAVISDGIIEVKA